MMGMVSATDADRIVQLLASSDLSGAALRKRGMELLDELSDYDWSGIYRLEEDTLVLDEYVGAATDHTRIKVGVGVCGTAVAENANQVIADVRELDNYLACSLQTRAEIVVLIKDGDEILGQIDIDGHRVRAFDASDETLLARMADIFSERWT